MNPPFIESRGHPSTHSSLHLIRTPPTHPSSRSFLYSSLSVTTYYILHTTYSSLSVASLPLLTRAAPHGDTSPEQLARAVGTAQLPVPGIPSNPTRSCSPELHSNPVYIHTHPLRSTSPRSDPLPPLPPQELFISSGTFDTAFRITYGGGQSVDNAKLLDANSLLRPLMLRRIKEEVCFSHGSAHDHVVCSMQYVGEKVM